MYKTACVCLWVGVVKQVCVYLWVCVVKQVCVYLQVCVVKELRLDRGNTVSRGITAFKAATQQQPKQLDQGSIYSLIEAIQPATGNT